VEEHIRRKLDNSAARSTVYHLSLLRFDAQRDIRAFMESYFLTIYDENRRLMKGVPLPWPSKTDLDSLVEKSDGSFIFAVTLMDFVRKGNGVPEDRLQKALTAEGGLDTLYAQVLTDAPRDDNFERVIGSIMILVHPLSITLLAALLRLRTQDVIHALLGTQSIVMISGSDDEEIRLFHTSLRDFLVSQERAGQFYVDPARRHLAMTELCITNMTVHPQNDIFYRKEQEYACFNWCHHFARGVIDGGDDLLNLWTWDSMMVHLREFASQAVDTWVNTLLLYGPEKQQLQLEVLRLAVSRLKVSLIHLPWNCRHSDSCSRSGQIVHRS
jgi:hypothetical protein